MTTQLGAYMAGDHRAALYREVLAGLAASEAPDSAAFAGTAATMMPDEVKAIFAAGEQVQAIDSDQRQNFKRRTGPRRTPGKREGGGEAAPYDRPRHDKAASARELGRPPAFPDKPALARELCMAESTIDDFVKRSILPPPIELSSGCKRWDWEEVNMRIRARKRGGAEGGGDPYDEGFAKLAEQERAARAAKEKGDVKATKGKTRD